MSATNTTTNYNLPIFIGSDKPSWLADFNGAMNAIDTQMKTNADAIATKSPILTFNDTTDIELDKTGNIVTATLASGVSDKVGRSLVKPLSAPANDQLVGIDTNGDQSALDIGSGLIVDSNTLKAVDLNLSDITKLTSIATGQTGVTATSCNITAAFNADKSIMKFYGRIIFNNTSSNSYFLNIDTGITVPAPDEEWNIDPAGLAFKLNAYAFGQCFIVFHTNGHIYIRVNVSNNAQTYAYFWPCVYFLTDFGDTPTP